MKIYNSNRTCKLQEDELIHIYRFIYTEYAW